MYDGLPKKKEGGIARADRRAPSQTGTATPRMRSCMRCAAWKPVQYIPHILGYVVKLLETANKSHRSPVNPPQLLHPNPQETSEDGTAIVKVAEHKSLKYNELIGILFG